MDSNEHTFVREFSRNGMAEVNSRQLTKSWSAAFTPLHRRQSQCSRTRAALGQFTLKRPEGRAPAVAASIGEEGRGESLKRGCVRRTSRSRWGGARLLTSRLWNNSAIKRRLARTLAPPTALSRGWSATAALQLIRVHPWLKNFFKLLAQTVRKPRVYEVRLEIE